ncbi:aromatic amino acid hydroxylase [Brevibacillus borstelensis]|uniref:aromatic amino acid hydroxylase n=1 Tax=Brevibacillus TaxID=55080 RepID=UPI00148FB84A|nr:aromatic amino acid hydroxylase [Brevibacillus borstelensis]MCC0563777.1 aromatic amino acid hydroxylase [Brevibacillus borstelensis]MCM3469524.1 aromatic amino acid hydroxylase [Brevibacillus borstelensis]MCM3559219.1 aromatic amino acid hydroxylase [Brevibacillus borstelensis]MCM3589344.1 aromatic amino acid hydroxylase [Brevibacillus borstelensis]MCM3623575.1 aromatic amino acid hydroxylase [Brevibacillus borstelensis]
MSRVEPDFSLVQVPIHLKEFVVEQDYEQYTPIDHAVWRYVMRQNHHYLGQTAHSAYLEGLRLSGISVERIPNIREMNECLAKIGWGAVTIDGFIPAVAFFDFQAHRILPIACDIRQYDHIAYTPAPDIIHEAAGHAPIILDETYRSYLKIFGEIGSRALSSKEDYELYEAIRYLSIVKEDPESTEEVIRQAEEELERKAKAVQNVSEANELARLYWWTVEYGLIGDCENPRIYGAGLLSSVGESISCLQDDVKKIPFSLQACIETDYDITKPQPQLFVCRDFQELIDAILEYSKRMALNVGGTESLIKARNMPQTTTAVYSSGLQVSGILAELEFDSQGEAVYLKTTGPSALAVGNKELPGHGKQYHAEGFGSPIGRLAGESTPLECFTDEQLQEKGIVPGKRSILSFESGLQVAGVVRYILREGGRLVLIGFDECTVTYQDKTLFQAEWGTFDMAVGERIVSVFAGAADREAFATGTHKPSVISARQSSYSPEQIRLHQLYQQVRNIREKQQAFDRDTLLTILDELDADYPEDWLIRLELLEILYRQAGTEHEQSRLHSVLEKLKDANPNQKQLIMNGLQLLGL